MKFERRAVKRIVAAAVTAVMLSGLLSVPVFPAGTVGAGAAVAAGFDELNDGERAILTSGLIVEELYDVEVPGEDAFTVKVDPEAKTVLAETDAEGDWRVGGAKIVTKDGEIPVTPDGATPFECDEIVYTASVDFRLYVPVSETERARLANGPYYLIKSLGNIAEIDAHEQTLAAIGRHTGDLSRLTDGSLSVGILVFKITDKDTVASINNLQEQSERNGGPLDLDVMLHEYESYPSGTGYLIDHGEEFKAKAIETYNDINQLANDPGVKTILRFGSQMPEYSERIQDALDKINAFLEGTRDPINDEWAFLNAENNILKADLTDEELALIDGYVEEGAGAEMHDGLPDEYLPALTVTVSLRVVAPHDHEFGEWTAETPASCTEEGVDVRACSICGEEERRKSEPLGHVILTNMAQEPTCTAEGHTESKICTRCGEVILASEPIPALGHDIVISSAGQPTCTVAGHTEGQYCSRCGETIVEPETIPALGHDFGEWTTVTPATCTENGGEGRTCSRCGETETRIIPAKGHDFGENEKVCLVCGAENPDYKPPVQFSDVKSDAYYAAAVAWAVENEITAGTSKTTFSPDKPCTRGQVVTFLWRAAGSPKVDGSNPFKDVKSTDYFYDAVLWAVKEGITSGISATKFGPSDTCTRGQIATFLYRAAGSPKIGGATNPFKDVKSTDYFYTPVLWAVGAGVTQGTSSTKFSPSNTCTRGQVVTFLYRAKSNS